MAGGRATPASRPNNSVPIGSCSPIRAGVSGQLSGCCLAQRSDWVVGIGFFIPDLTRSVFGKRLPKKREQPASTSGPRFYATRCARA